MSKTAVTITPSLQSSQSLEQISTEVPFNPGFYANQTEFILTNHYTSSDMKIFGAAEVLENLEVSFNTISLLIFVKLTCYHLKIEHRPGSLKEYGATQWILFNLLCFSYLFQYVCWFVNEFLFKY